MKTLAFTSFKRVSSFGLVSSSYSFKRVSSFEEKKPRFVVDEAEGLKFLGHKEGHDLYYCPIFKDIIARFGNEPQEYRSGTIFAGVIPALAMAKKIAIEKGLVVKDY